MGLDMYLYATKYVSGWEFSKDPTYDQLVTMYAAQKLITADSPSATVSFCCIYWRKANAIHRWFVNEVQEGNDNCERYYVHRKQLIDLRNRCDEVLAQPNKASSLLPTQAGFFFGGTAYDEYYLFDIEHTRNSIDRVLEVVLENPDDPLHDWEFYYQASW